MQKPPGYMVGQSIVESEKYDLAKALDEIERLRTENRNLNSHIYAGRQPLLDEIERLRADFNAYARHTDTCEGGDGTRCQCGFLDCWTRVNEQ